MPKKKQKSGTKVPTKVREVVKLRPSASGDYLVIGHNRGGMQYLKPAQVPQAFRDMLARRGMKWLYVEASCSTLGRWQLRGLAADQDQGW